ncbi:hypothetical protein QRX60_32895 [Amycolatopsis mongoliensis]|uniref:Uncharacterized protein n=1 Tax=Amycolatopsis mongoliensis TaxID=715475 RepID=A0A9Y2JK82_9PSEU|nr:hypothetical protein [Amycolatopsis sp. 4-36]WIX98838.1 hypothetical protein QRX60_32895 [Amycolatopsis sp. 4-36]
MVGWREGTVLLDAAQEALGDDPHHEGEECAAFDRLTSAISGAMAEAMHAILTAAGPEVVRDAEDVSAHELLVTRRLTPSPWRARRATTRCVRPGTSGTRTSARTTPDGGIHGPLRDR